MQKFMEVLKDITAKQIIEMTEEEKAFIRARRDYLSEVEKQTLKSILEDVKEPLIYEHPEAVGPEIKPKIKRK
jgi:hypothetical protein